MPTRREPGSDWCSLDTHDGRAQLPDDWTCDPAVGYNPTRSSALPTVSGGKPWPTLINPA
jgi:hypothetical protein